MTKRKKGVEVWVTKLGRDNYIVRSTSRQSTFPGLRIGIPERRRIQSVKKGKRKR